MGTTHHYFLSGQDKHTLTGNNFLLDCNHVITKYMEDPGFDIHILANQLNLSSSQLTRRIKSMTGMPPGRYLLDARLMKAKYLLEESREPIKNVALLCGFSSYPAFWQAFNKRYSQSPGAYAHQEDSLLLSPSVQWSFLPKPNAIESLHELLDYYDWFSIFLKISIEEINNRQLRLEDLASETCYSPSQLLRNFKRTMDVTPMSFIKHLRLLYAIDLIEKNNLLITAIAYQSGFSDQAHLCRSFKAHCGISISTFKKNRPDFLGFSRIRDLVNKVA